MLTKLTKHSTKYGRIIRAVVMTMFMGALATAMLSPAEALAARRKKTSAPQKPAASAKLERTVARLQRLQKGRGLSTRDKKILRKLETQLGDRKESRHQRKKRRPSPAIWAGDSRPRKVSNQVQATMMPVKSAEPAILPPTPPDNTVEYVCNLWRDSSRFMIHFPDESFLTPERRNEVRDILKERNLKSITLIPDEDTAPGVLEFIAAHDLIADRDLAARRLLALLEARSGNTFHFVGICKK